MTRSRWPPSRFRRRCLPADRLGLAGAAAERDRLSGDGPPAQGTLGVEAIHGALLGARISGPLSTWPIGLPVLCSRNLPELGLANGDVRMCSVGPESAPDQRRLLFGDGAIAFTPSFCTPAQLAGAVEPGPGPHGAQGPGQRGGGGDRAAAGQWPP